MDHGRDARGRFAAGNPGGPGRPSSAVEFEYQWALRDTITPDELRRVLKKVLVLAKKGDLKAIQLILRYCLMEPMRRLEVHDPYNPEFRLAGKSPADVDREMLQRLMEKIQERRAYQEKLAEAEKRNEERLAVLRAKKTNPQPDRSKIHGEKDRSTRRDVARDASG